MLSTIPNREPIDNREHNGNLEKFGGGVSGVAIHLSDPISNPSNLKLQKTERAMRTNQTVSSRFGQIGKGVALAGAIAALSLTNPMPAHAGGNGVGAAIGLGILGGVVAGAAIANSTQPAYGYGYGPAPAYDYPPQPYQGYYAPAPTYYDASQPYYGWSPYYR
jgi:hypothetical protein